MRNRIPRVYVLIALVALITATVSAQAHFGTPSSTRGADRGPAIVLNEVAGATEPATYTVQLLEPPLASYRGGIAGLAATNPGLQGQVKLDPSSPASLAYLNYLDQQHGLFVAAMESVVGHPVEVRFRYKHAFNGLAVRVTPQEAARIAALPGVLHVQREVLRHLDTDAGPAWIGAPTLWDGSNTGGLPGTKGEGIVVGIIDSGINTDHPSFAATGGDGYKHTNPRRRFYGLCNSTTGVPFCNPKLIGVYDFTGLGTGPEDDNGHGSHTASTTAGNAVSAVVSAPTTSITRTISGVAPHANIISYKACFTTPARGGCLSPSLVAAIDQATADRVDVINYSIGGTSSNPWTDADAQAFLGARAAGVFVAASAGNSGPNAETIGSPSDAPWLTTVGASTHSRSFVNALVNLTGGSTPPPADILGKSFTASYGPKPIVYARDFGNNARCEAVTEATSEGRGFPAGTNFKGAIVICDRGINGRVAKGQNVKDVGAGGMVLANDEANGNSVTADPHVLPAVHISFVDGNALKAWVKDGGTGHTATIAGSRADLAAANADIMAGFSSRGPDPSVPDVLKPDVTAPGVDILAALSSTIPPGPRAEFGLLSGTSMSSPHTAGSAALLRALHPDWSPAEVQSALMTTAFNTAVRKEDGQRPADPFDMGAGRIDLTVASKAGLVLDEAEPRYTNANPAKGGDPKTLNLASMANSKCEGTCSWTRVVSSTLASSMTWTASTTAPAGMQLTVTPNSFTLAPGSSQEIVVTANVSGLPAGQQVFAQVTLVPSDNAVPSAHFPVAVLPGGKQPGGTATTTSTPPSEPTEPIEEQPTEVTSTPTATTATTTGTADPSPTAVTATTTATATGIGTAPAQSTTPTPTAPANSIFLPFVRR